MKVLFQVARFSYRLGISLLGEVLRAAFGRLSGDVSHQSEKKVEVIPPSDHLSEDVPWEYIPPGTSLLDDKTVEVPRKRPCSLLREEKEASCLGSIER